MGGPGSGTWYRWDTKTTIEDVHRLNIRYLNTHGLLRPGYIGTLTWSCGDRQTGTIGLWVKHEYLVLDYRYRYGSGDWEPVQETVWFDWTPCHYGGMRPWLLCPRCSRRVAVLYLYGRRFLCRQCHRLPYASQQEIYQDRMMRKARKIRKRLGASMSLFEPIYPWERPTGMHWSTFERLRRQEEHATNALLWAMWMRLKRLR